jgi:hypothetical protein
VHTNAEDNGILAKKERDTKDTRQWETTVNRRVNMGALEVTVMLGDSSSERFWC